MRRVLSVALVLMMILVGCGNQNYSANQNEDDRAGTKGEDLYGSVLANYIKAYNEKWDYSRFQMNDMSPYFVKAYELGKDKPLDYVGYVYINIARREFGYYFSSNDGDSDSFVVDEDGKVYFGKNINVDSAYNMLKK